jgi:beta-galactosidase/beta-glucuronidase
MIERKMHPRPQFIRKKWQTLDGHWKFIFDDNNVGLNENWNERFPQKVQTILVPFTYETKASGIQNSEQHRTVWYQRDFQVNSSENHVLYFEGVDYETQVWLNGHLIGSHKGGYERFSFDTGPYLLEGKNTITVRVTDSFSCEQPRGKQRWKKENFGCWYVQTTGIWKSVWIERAEPQRIRDIKLKPELMRDSISIEVALNDSSIFSDNHSYFVEAESSFDGREISYHKSIVHHNHSSFIMDTREGDDPDAGTHRWTPETPALYDLILRLYDRDGILIDEVFSYFGMRQICIENGQILLNNRTLYQRLILDQGYWVDSGLTPPSANSLEQDLEKIKQMGYNGVRKHQKIEDDRFYYLCDTKGILVWVEMPSTYVFNDSAIEQFTYEWIKIVKQLYNHPSIITWVPFNESWGIKGVNSNKRPQHFTEGIYHLTKSIDSDRPVITNDGWEHTVSDIVTLHDYEELGEIFKQRYGSQLAVDSYASLDKKNIIENRIQFNDGWFAFASNYSYNGQPIIISEFGGIAFSSSNDDEWGYGNKENNESEFMERFRNIHKAIQEIPYISGYCYTQLTDVEQEVNGLLTAERKEKVNLKEVKRVNEHCS